MTILSYYAMPEDDHDSLPPEKAFVCACPDWQQSACKGLPSFREYEGKAFCVLHYPARDKVPEFSREFQRKMRAEDYNFAGVFFPEEINFSGLTLSAEANFSYTTFSALVSFRFATFSAEAFFSNATFSAEADFSNATFSARAFFSNATFSARANFTYASFDKIAVFEKTKFLDHANFSLCRVKDSLKFWRCVFAPETKFEFDAAVFEKPEWISFHTVTLHPSWFVNVDARKLDFLNVKWENLQDYDAELTRLGEQRPELRRLRQLPGESERTKLAVNDAPPPAGRMMSPQFDRSLEDLLLNTYRQLAVNAEELHRYGAAAEFRYAAMDLWKPNWKEHQQDWWRNPKWWSETAVWLMHFAYKWLSGYGERVGRALLTLVIILFLFAGSYHFVGFEDRQVSGKGAVPVVTSCGTSPDCPLKWRDVFHYTLNVAMLQKPEPKAYTTWAKMMVAIETLLAPLQAALLALAIRRRFMK